MIYQSSGERDTIVFGAYLASLLRRGDIVCLYGDLGSGKTTFVKGMAKGLKINQDDVSSPTFVILNIYKGVMPLYHFDFYRLDRMNEMGMIGYDEFLYGQGIAAVEWAERLGPLCPKEYVSVHIKHSTDNTRLLTCEAVGARYQALVGKINKRFTQ